MRLRFFLFQNSNIRRHCALVFLRLFVFPFIFFVLIYHHQPTSVFFFNYFIFRTILPKISSYYVSNKNNNFKFSTKISNQPSQNTNQQLSSTSSSSTTTALTHQQQHLQLQLQLQQHQQLQLQQNKKNLTDYINGHQTPMGRQGAIKDVQSIIADYRQKHPEIVPRRGRRLRPSYLTDSQHPHQQQHQSNSSSSTKRHLQQLQDNRNIGELGYLLSGMDGTSGGGNGNSRPSSADSSHSNSNSNNINLNAIQTSTPNTANVSFKDVLVKFAKMSQNERQNTASLLTANNSKQTAPPPYPEVTLHPLNSSNQDPQSISHTNSLLHGILTKVSD